MQTSRQLVLKILIKMHKNNAYSNILLDDALSKSSLTPQDKKFASALFYGVIEREITLDKIINKYSNRRADKLSVEVRVILQMGLYQLLYLDSVPESAAVNESVNLAKGNKNTAIAGFINALLRSFIRDGKQLPKGKTKLESLALEYSAPEWLIEKWLADYGEVATKTILRTSLGRAPITIRVNSVKTSADEVINSLEENDVIAEKCDITDNCIEVHNTSAIEKLSSYKDGYFHVQDISSQLCAKALGAKSGDIVLDVCSAPGGKAFTIAEIMGNKGEIYAFDLHEKRAQLIWNGAKRLGLDIIKAGTNNAKVYNEKIKMADKILCDVPCSGLGVIRRKPEIKFKNPDDFNNLPAIQYEILCTSWKYLKKGGELIYSTCTLSKAENDEVVDKFISEHSDCEKSILLEHLGGPFGDYKATILPDFCNSDGFFIAKLKKGGSDE